MRLEDIPRRRERLIIASMALKLNRAFNLAIRPKSSAQADTSYVLQAIYFGDLSNTPMTANKISLFLDMPRTTVIGRLEFLLKYKYIVRNSRTYSVADEKLAKPTVNLNQIVAIILEAAADLSKTDT